MVKLKRREMALLRSCLMRMTTSSASQLQLQSFESPVLSVSAFRALPALVPISLNYSQQPKCNSRAFAATDTSGNSSTPYDTTFLGTPASREELQQKRPISPHLFPTTDGKHIIPVRPLMLTMQILSNAI